MTNSDFLNSVYQTAIGMGIPDPQARLAAAQAALETGYGKSAPGNNLFGIKGSGQTLPTKESVNGNLTPQQASFRTYPSTSASIADWYGLLQTNWPTAASAATFEGAASGLNNGKYGPYASDAVEANDPLTYTQKLGLINQTNPAQVTANSSGSPDDRDIFSPPPLVPPTDQGNPAANFYNPNNTAPLQSSASPSLPAGTLNPPAFPLGAQWMDPQAQTIASDQGNTPAGWTLGQNSSGALTQAQTPLPLPSFAAPVVPSASAPTTAPNLVKLASGKMIAPGTYGDSIVTDDGHGNAVVTVTRNALAAGPGTIVGGIAGKMIDQAAQSASSTIGNSVNAAKTSLGTAAGAVQSGIQTGLGNAGNAVTGFLGGLGNMFGGTKSTQAPAGPLSSGMPYLGTSSSAALGTPQSAPVQQINPAYTAWEQSNAANAAVTQNLMGQAASSEADVQDARMLQDANLGEGGITPKPIPVAPPKFITKPAQIAAPVQQAPAPPSMINGSAVVNGMYLDPNGSGRLISAAQNPTGDTNTYEDKSSAPASGVGGDGGVAQWRKLGYSSPAAWQAAGSQTFTGTSGRQYQVGQNYTNASGTYMAMPSGGFQRVTI